MRELLLILIVAAICLVAPFQPRIGLYGYIWFALMRPDLLCWSNKPYSVALAIATLLGTVRFFPRVKVFFTNPIILTLLLLQIPIVVSILLAQDRSLTVEPFNLYGRMLIMVLPIPLLIDSHQTLRSLMLVIMFSLGALAVKFGLYGLVNGGVRFSQGYGGLLGDNNALALALVMVLPLCWYGRELVSQLWSKAILLAMALLSVVVVVMTHSRGAALSLAITFLAIAFRSKRRAGVVILFLLIFGGSAYMVRQSYITRLSTLQNPGGESSASLRILYAKVAFRIWRDHPLFGVGFGTLNEMNVMGKYIPLSAHGAQVIHNTYLQMLTDSGTAAALIYVFLVFGVLFWLGRSARRMALFYPDLAVYPAMLHTSLLAFAIGSTFLSRVEFDLFYMLLMGAAVWYGIEPAVMPDPVPAAESLPVPTAQASSLALS